MIRILTSLVLAAVVVREVREFRRRYRDLKVDLARGDVAARLRLYRRAFVFQGAIGFLALLALGFDPRALTPDALELSGVPFLHAFTPDVSHGLLPGVIAGVVTGSIGLFLAQRRAARSGRAVTPRWRLGRVLPDFGALLPVTATERWTWLALAVVVGTCEEIVFRGWLLSVLHQPLGLAGLPLIVAAAAGFGFAHAYQGPTGIALTGLAAVLFIGLYVATGSLLVPILLHVAVDARFALMPSSPARALAPEEPALAAGATLGRA